MEGQDPQLNPGEPGTEEGQSVEGAPQGTPPVDEGTNRLADLEAQNKKLQDRLTEKGRRLAQMEQNTQEIQKDPETGEWNWENPGQYIRSTVSTELLAMEGRLEQKRQAEQTLRDFAEEKGISTRELQRLNDRLQAASSDPYEYLEMLSKLHAAENTSEAITQAKDAALASERNNARAVTTESGVSNADPPGKTIDDMSADELEQYIKDNHGVEERY